VTPKFRSFVLQHWYLFFTEIFPERQLAETCRGA